MRPFVLLAALAISGPARAADAAPETIFACSFGARQVDVTLERGALTYRFGRPGRPELVLAGGAYYHRTLYPHGENQTLRFVSAHFPT